MTTAQKNYIEFISEQTSFSIEDINQMIQKGLKLKFSKVLTDSELIEEWKTVQKFADENPFMIECNHCDGKGFVEYIENGDESGPAETCCNCDGKGEIQDC